jgi:hypothetical protein
MDTDMLMGIASAISFAALFILWGLAPAKSALETSPAPARALAEPVA